MDRVALVAFSTINLLIAAWETWRQISDVPAYREYKRGEKYGRQKNARSRGNNCRC